MKNVILKMNSREWKVGVVSSTSKRRFSSGWDMFVKENKLNINDKLNFVIVENDVGISFVVRVI